MRELPIDKMNLIQKYLGSGLSENENVAFKSYLNEQSFRDELVFQTDVLEALSDIRLEQASAVIDQAREEYSHREIAEEVTSKSVSKFIYIGLLALLILAIGAQYIASNRVSESREIFAVYYEPYEINGVQRGGAVERGQAEEKALRLYKLGNYAEAEKYFEQTNINSDKLKLYQGITYLHQDDFSKAQKVFKSIQFSEDRNLSQQADWYLSMLYFKHDLPLDAKALLESITKNPNHLYYEKAQKILAN